MAARAERHARLHLREVSLCDTRRRAGSRAHEHLLVWGDLPQWLVIDDELNELLKRFDGRRTVDQVIRRHAQERHRDRAAVQAEVLPLIDSLLQRGILCPTRPSRRRAEPEPLGIANLTINLTNRCNLSCPFCYNGARAGAELPAEQLLAALAAARASSLCDPDASLIILGGEPLLDRPRLFAVLDRAAELFTPAPLVSTNGTLLSEQVVAELRSRRVEVQVSLDSPGRERHDALRGRGVWDKAVTGIRRLVGAGVYTIMSMVYTSESAGDFEGYLGFARELGVNEARFIPLRSIGKGLDHPALRPDQHAVFEHLLGILERRPELSGLLARDYFSIMMAIFRCSTPRTSCGIGRKVIFIDADGSVYPCPNHVSPAHRAGHLSEQPLSEIVRASPVMQRCREQYQVHRYRRCRSCPFRFWCAGDCRGEVLALEGDCVSPSPHCDELRRVYTRVLWLLAAGDRRLGNQAERAGTFI